MNMSGPKTQSSAVRAVPGESIRAPWKMRLAAAITPTTITRGIINRFMIPVFFIAATSINVGYQSNINRRVITNKKISLGSASKIHERGGIYRPFRFCEISWFKTLRESLGVNSNHGDSLPCAVR